MSTTPSWMAEPSETPPTSTATAPSYGGGDLAGSGTNTPTWLAPDISGDVEQGGQQKLQPVEMVTGVDEPAPVETPAAQEAPGSKSWGQYFRESCQRDGRLILITVLIIVLMNIPFVQWALYPFTIFSTWIHEICHGLAAVMAGGSISKLEIFPDTSGLAYTSVAGNRRGFVVSAGYQGTAVIGCLLLLVRRTKRGPRSGTMGVALMMILSVILWIRNAFGIVFILLLGVLLAGAAWKLPSNHMRNLYMVLAVTCALNAIASTRNLYGTNHKVNGQEVSTDAHTMADLKGGTAAVWATIWLLLALFVTVIGILFAIPGPDEVADFTVCGVCQDLGVFSICNFKGQRLWGRMFGKNDENDAGNAEAANQTSG